MRDLPPPFAARESTWGPDLSNLTSRDYASVLKDIIEPNAAINPDAVGYVVTVKDGDQFTGTRSGETETELKIAQPGGEVVAIKKADIRRTSPMAISLMPEGFEKGLSPDELRDLMTFLLTDRPAAPSAIKPGN